MEEKLITIKKTRETTKVKYDKTFTVRLKDKNSKVITDKMVVRPKNTARSFHLPIRFEVGSLKKPNEKISELKNVLRI
jgi:hypothetical protein